MTPMAASPRSVEPVVRDLLDVAHQAVRESLHVCPGPGPERKAVLPFAVERVGKRRLDRVNSLVAQMLTSRAVDGPLLQFRGLVRGLAGPCQISPSGAPWCARNATSIAAGARRLCNWPGRRWNCGGSAR